MQYVTDKAICGNSTVYAGAAVHYILIVLSTIDHVMSWGL